MRITTYPWQNLHTYLEIYAVEDLDFDAPKVPQRDICIQCRTETAAVTCACVVTLCSVECRL